MFEAGFPAPSARVKLEILIFLPDFEQMFSSQTWFECLQLQMFSTNVKNNKCFEMFLTGECLP